jgi:hypothetical protein
MNATTEELREALGNLCEFCGPGLSGHRYAMLASAIARSPDDPKLLEFIRHFAVARWTELAAVQEFDPMKNAAVVYAIECPQGVIDVALVRDSFELCESKTIEERRAALDHDAEVIRGLIKEWTDF